MTPTPPTPSTPPLPEPRDAALQPIAPQGIAPPEPAAAAPAPSPVPLFAPVARVSGPNPTFTRILADWQAEIQYAIEAGVAPALGAESGSSVGPALVGLEAVRLLAEARRDMTSPVVTAGGASGAWLSQLMQPQVGPLANSPSLVTLFAGADEATQIASAGTLPRAPAGLAPPGNRMLPNGYRPQVAPTLQPASPVTWESLPLQQLEIDANPLGALPAGAAAGWVALLFVALLILGALAL